MGTRSFEARLLAEGALVGIGAGLAVAAFRWLLDASDAFRAMLYGHWIPGTSWALPLWIAALLLVAWILGRIQRACPMAMGSGIPQTKGLLQGRLQVPWAQALVLKFLGAVLGIGAGLSLGRQGPSIQLGACVGQGVAARCGRAEEEGRFLVLAGAGAGLSAAFNAPLAGVLFCAEELSRRLSPAQILSSMVAAATADAVAQIAFGTDLAFRMDTLPAVLPAAVPYLAFICLGLLCGLLGLAFNRSLLLALDLYDRSPLQGFWRMLPPLLCAGLLGFALPEILGGGDRLVDSLQEQGYALPFLLLLFAGKFLFTILCFGSGAPGGIFLPMMALGALSGAVFAHAVQWAFGLDPAWAGYCIVFGMAGFFAGAVKAPVSSSILVMELTRSFDLMLPLLCVTLVACVALDMAGCPPVYDALLARQLRKGKDGGKTS